MKLRIRGDSVRIRVSQTELARLADDGAAEDCIRFPGGAELRYRVEIRPVDGVDAALADGTLSVVVPESAARRWLEPDEVSIAGERPLAGGGALAILVEKDFTCLNPREGEDDADLFPNPAVSR